MKSVYFAAVIGVFAASAVNAQCACAPTDSACLNECVGQTNSCIAECKSSIECYEICISNHWPGVDSNYSETSMMNMPSSTWMESSTWSATPTWSSSMWSESSWASSATPTWSSSMWSQSSTWPSNSWASGSSWYPSYTGSGSMMPTNMNPAASATIMPTHSAATTTQISKIAIGLGLACAAYILR